MRRKVKFPNRLVPDSVYDSAKVAKLTNYLMEDGKKEVARKIVYDCFNQIKEVTKSEPLEVFNEAMRNVGPLMELKSRRVGGANYQIPHEVTPERRLVLALRWIIEAAYSKKGKPMHKKLADEIITASKNEGEAIKKRENVHRMAEANRAFAHYAKSYKKKTV
ncbi:MAG: 30S ribosomal protein S7 [Patescibacteria group bacterium]